MARRCVFFVSRVSDGIVLEVSELLTDCMDAVHKAKLKKGEYVMAHEWVECGGQTR